jgi:integral membrane protein
MTSHDISRQKQLLLRRGSALVGAMTILRSLRVVSLCEGVSYLLLLFVAMPLKYVWEWPLAVKYVGWAHGVLFMLLGALVLLAMLRASLPFMTAIIVGIASLLPAGPFFADRLLRRHEAATNGSRP